jgi:cation diffusion facilitator CzcD-associated flavoprotein CzcO
VNLATELDVAIVGAGPYALSIAAHLRAKGVEFRIFGKPLQTWREHMPKGMYLKSEGCASNLFDPIRTCSLGQFCEEDKLPYGAMDVPVSLETFTKYALAFQERFVPAVEEVMVSRLDGEPGRFELQLENGETVKSSKVILATGVCHAAHVPEELAVLPAELRSHSSNHQDLSRFAGRKVAVIGAGQSAIETAALLHEVKAEVLLVARRPELAWNETPRPGRRSLYQRLRRPASALGPGLGPWVYSNVPGVFRRLPQRTRFRVVKRVLGPAGAWWLRDRVVGRVSTMVGTMVETAECHGDGVLLRLRSLNGERREVTADHVIAATGYRFLLRSLPFVSEGLVARVATEDVSPLLSSNFESSVAGLFFTGLASANAFGPAMRFLHGAGFTARRISRHIGGQR